MRALPFRKVKVIVVVSGLVLAACGPTMGTDLGSPQAQGKEADVGQLSGVVDSIEPGSLLVNGEMILTSEAKIQGEIAVGDNVQVRFSLGPDGQLLASSVESMGHMTEDEFEFTGTVVSIADDEWVIAGRTLQVGTFTEIKGDIQVGDVVKVHAFLDEAGLLSAHEIELTADEHVGEDDNSESGEELEFTGTVTLIEADQWTIDGRVVRVTSDTEVKGDVGEGSLVKVHATLTPEGDLLAREIEPVVSDSSEDDHQGGQDTVEFKGIVTEMGAEAWVIDEQAVQITPQTKIESDVQVGDLVEVKAMQGEGEILIALEIELEHRGNDDINQTSQVDDDEDDDGYEEPEDSEGHDHADDDEDEHDDEYGGEYGGTGGDSGSYHDDD